MRLLKKRWHSIPVALVAVLLAVTMITGSVFAWYEVTQGTADVTVIEAITIANVDGDDGNFVGYDPSVWTVSMYPGEMKALWIEVTNASSADLEVVATVDPISDDGLTVTGNAGISLAEPVTIPGNSSGVFAIEVHADGDAAPNTYSFDFELHRR